MGTTGEGRAGAPPHPTPEPLAEAAITSRATAFATQILEAGMPDGEVARSVARRHAETEGTDGELQALIAEARAACANPGPALAFLRRLVSDRARAWTASIEEAKVGRALTEPRESASAVASALRELGAKHDVDARAARFIGVGGTMDVLRALRAAVERLDDNRDPVGRLLSWMDEPPGSWEPRMQPTRRRAPSNTEDRSSAATGPSRAGSLVGGALDALGASRGANAPDARLYGETAQA